VDKLSINIKKNISNNHRGCLDLMADILETAQNGGVKKTCLMSRCNLSFKQLKYYLDLLITKGLLRIDIKAASSNQGLFETTAKGKKFLETYNCLKALTK
jgi:predicted transcriptional regulator